MPGPPFQYDDPHSPLLEEDNYPYSSEAVAGRERRIPSRLEEFIHRYEPPVSPATHFVPPDPPNVPVTEQSDDDDDEPSHIPYVPVWRPLVKPGPPPVEDRGYRTANRANSTVKIEPLPLGTEPEPLAEEDAPLPVKPLQAFQKDDPTYILPEEEAQSMGFRARLGLGPHKTMGPDGPFRIPGAGPGPAGFKGKGYPHGYPDDYPLWSDGVPVTGWYGLPEKKNPRTGRWEPASNEDILAYRGSGLESSRELREWTGDLKTNWDREKWKNKLREEERQRKEKKHADPMYKSLKEKKRAAREVQAEIEKYSKMSDEELIADARPDHIREARKYHMDLATYMKKYYIKREVIMYPRQVLRRGMAGYAAWADDAEYEDMLAKAHENQERRWAKAREQAVQAKEKKALEKRSWSELRDWDPNTELPPDYPRYIRGAGGLQHRFNPETKKWVVANRVDLARVHPNVHVYHGGPTGRDYIKMLEAKTSRYFPMTISRKMWDDREANVAANEWDLQMARRKNRSVGDVVRARLSGSHLSSDSD
jgi:hypothetical protein